MTPQQLSAWYAERFSKPADRDYSSEEFKLDLEFLDSKQRGQLFQEVQRYLSEVTYYKDGEQINIDQSNQEEVTRNFYFNTMTIPNVELLKALHKVLGEA